TDTADTQPRTDRLEEGLAPVHEVGQAQAQKHIYVEVHLLSVAVTTTSVATTELIKRGWSLPTFQTFFLYAVLNLTYTPYTIWSYGFVAWAKMMLSLQSLAYLFLAVVDVEANFAVLKAFSYSDMLSCMLLDAWATPACLIFAFFLVKARYHWSQIFGVIVCISGLGLLVTSDYHIDQTTKADNKVIGDILMLVGATGYGLSNALVDRFVRKRPLYEVMGALGFFGCIVNAIQGVVLERDAARNVPWNASTIAVLMAYVLGMVALYTLAPILYRLSSSPFANISILTSDFWGLAVGLVFYNYKPYWLYFVAFAVIMLGLIIYFSVARPEDVAPIEIVARGRQLDKQTQQRRTWLQTAAGSN
ncbi:hypothetical protein OIO90_006591, partial [Microbotryomycetes sp. JL221]